MNNRTFLQIQALELQRLLGNAADDPLLEKQLRVRLADAEKELEALGRQEGNLLSIESVVLPRAAIFLRGGGVEGSEGIRPSLAGEALIQYEKMFTEQALHDERAAAKKAGRQRRPRGATTPGLLFTGTPRGSFGFEFVPQPTEDAALLEVHAQSLRNVADTLVLVAGERPGEPLDDTIKQIPARVLQPLKQFMKTLAQYGAEIRLAFPDRPVRSLTIMQVKNAAERLEKEVSQEILTIPGVFRGLTRESGVFDLRTETGDVITGTVADDLTEDDLERIDLLTNKSCISVLQRTTVRKTTYVLLDAHEPLKVVWDKI